jgi:hypothetical protein
MSTQHVASKMLGQMDVTGNEEHKDIMTVFRE